MPQHTLSVLLTDSPGALARLTGLLERRRVAVDSLAYGATEHPGVRRVTVAVSAERRRLEHITRHLDNLVDVLETDRLTREPAGS
ncbi:acetolactate synthase small subunit [Streptomyces sioyaensis]|uniref:acetolactate synthase small subunit n=1 Tax=Streptomyces sioyaensis TaxID=67364 RepID=UPI0037D36559